MLEFCLVLQQSFEFLRLFHIFLALLLLAFYCGLQNLNILHMLTVFNILFLQFVENVSMGSLQVSMSLSDYCQILMCIEELILSPFHVQGLVDLQMFPCSIAKISDSKSGMTP